MAQIEVYQYAYMSDNYGVLIHDPATGETASVDAGDGQATLDALAHKGWELTQLWITHHHGDHTAGLMSVKEATGCEVLGPVQKSSPIKGLDRSLEEGDAVRFGGFSVEILHTPGHTLDMINYYIRDQKLLFTGDTLFALGCGRVFEGSMDMMWESLAKLRELPADTQVYCGHEYTLANARFAVTVDPQNAELAERAKAFEAMLNAGKATIPTQLGAELATNPFLRPDDPAIRQHLDMQNASDAEVFDEIRRRKDLF